MKQNQSKKHLYTFQIGIMYEFGFYLPQDVLQTHVYVCLYI